MAAIVEVDKMYPYASLSVPSFPVQTIAPIRPPFVITALSMGVLGAAILLYLFAVAVVGHITLRSGPSSPLPVAVLASLALLAVPTMLGSVISTIIRRRVDCLTVAGFLAGPCAGLLTFLLVQWIWLRNISAPSFTALGMILASYGASAAASAIVGFVLPWLCDAKNANELHNGLRAPVGSPRVSTDYRAG